VEHVEDMRVAYRVLVRKFEGKRALGNPDIDGRIKQKRIYKKWVGGMERIDLAQATDRWWDILKVVMDIHVPKNSGNFLTSWGSVSFSKKTVVHGVNNNNRNFLNG